MSKIVLIIIAECFQLIIFQLTNTVYENGVQRLVTASEKNMSVCVCGLTSPWPCEGQVHNFFVPEPWLIYSLLIILLLPFYDTSWKFSFVSLLGRTHACVTRTLPYTLHGILRIILHVFKEIILCWSVFTVVADELYTLLAR